ncbi:hypothetical protein MLD38_039870 [Melastoma candidum]|uniref:Uncharacterized protein n=1 Tax=Melastoma candidum TaxID=119954 RepID=A0ACB9L4N6_9MYRT|nr:hypothetical protein MLD38_039870 [Melastoma candidum]
MESTDSSSNPHSPHLPPGFRFHPTDEELVVHYLKRKVASMPLPVSIIAEVDLYKFDPWELPGKATFGEHEWYFFSPRDRKYPNGARPNRAATSGYWKATGTDKPIYSSTGNHKVGVKKALVFYGGKPPKGTKTNWIMHEFRLIDNNLGLKAQSSDTGSKKDSLRLDDWVLCRIYQKNGSPKPVDQYYSEETNEAGNEEGEVRGLSLFDRQNSKRLRPKFESLSSPGAFYQGIHLPPESSQFVPSSSSKPNNWTISASVDDDTAMKHAPPPQQQYWDGGGGVPKQLCGVGDEANSFVSLLNQLPQSSVFHPNTLVAGSISDGNFRQQFQLPGMNWNS